MVFRNGWSRAARVFVALAVMLAQQAALQTTRAQDVETKLPGERRATEVIHLFLDGKDADFVAAGTDELRGALKVGDVATIRDGLEKKYGKFVGLRQVSALQHGAFQIFDFPARFEHATVTLRITLDANLKLAGFHVSDVASDEAPVGDDDAAKLPPYAKLDSFDVSRLKLTSGELKLPAILTMPKASGKRPAVVLVHGSGPHDADETIGPNKPFRDLAVGLSSQGIAVLRYEKRTLRNGAKLDARKITLDDETCDDALAAVGLLRKREDIDPDRIYVIGHSLGGMAAPYIAKRDGKLAGIVMLAGSARPVLDVLEEQLQYIYGLDGKVADEEKKSLDEVHATIKTIREGKVDEKTPKILGVAADYWEKLDKLQPAQVAAKLDCRMLVIQGGRDYQVTKADLDVWQAALKNNKLATFKVYEKLNHLMHTGEGKATPAEYEKAGFVDPAVVNDIAAWIKDTTAAKK